MNCRIVTCKRVVKITSSTAFIQIYIFYFITTPECFPIKTTSTFYGESFQTATTFEGAFLESHGTVNDNRCYATTVLEGTHTDVWETFANSYGFQATAARESKTSNFCDAVWYGYSSQTITIRESPFTNWRDAGWDGHGSQSAAWKNVIFNWRDTIGNGHRRQACTTSVFVTYCVPICFD